MYVIYSLSIHNTHMLKVQAEDGKDDLTFGNQLKAINYLMKMDKPRIFSLERLDDPLILHSVELLAALFRCCENYNICDSIKENSPL